MISPRMEKQMSFVKRGDGKIVNILNEKSLTDEQKQILKELSQEAIKEDVKLTDTSDKKSGS